MKNLICWLLLCISATTIAGETSSSSQQSVAPAVEKLSVIEPTAIAKAQVPQQTQDATDKVVFALLKKTFKIGKSTTSDVRKRLGNPQSIIENTKSISWAYQLSSINKSLKGMRVETKNKKALDKIVNFTFKNDKLVSYTIAGSK